MVARAEGSGNGQERGGWEGQGVGESTKEQPEGPLQ